MESILETIVGLAGLGLILGLIKPKWSLFWTEKQTRSRALLVFGGIALGVAAVAGSLGFIKPVPVAQTDTTPDLTRKAQAAPQKWYEGGTLHKSIISTWKNGDDQDKLATCADYITTASTAIREKVGESGDSDTLKPYATALVKCVDEAASGGDMDNQKTSEVAILCMATMGWLK